MFIFSNLDLFCIDNTRVIYRKILYLLYYYILIFIEVSQVESYFQFYLTLTL